LVLDFGGNVERHGPIDQLKIKPASNVNGEAPAKECPECQSVIAAGYASCPDCGFEFPPSERQQHEATASQASVLSGEVTITTYEVSDVRYSVHTKRGAKEDDPKTMRVDYQVSLYEWQSEWVCFEHSGYARQRAIDWWQRHSPDPIPDTAERAVQIAEGGGVAMTRSITVRSVSGEEFDRIVDYQLGAMPEAIEISSHDYDDDEIPF
jgi:DNA repair protein RadD